MVPRKPKRPCSFPGCPNLTEGRFCEEHQKQENRRYEKYDRDPAVRRRYGRAWKRIRDRYASRHPFCEECQRKGLLRPVEEVHHKVPYPRAVPMRRATWFPFAKSATPESMQSVATDGTTADRRGGQNLYSQPAGERAWGAAHKNRKSNGGLTPGRKIKEIKCSLVPRRFADTAFFQRKSKKRG